MKRLSLSVFAFILALNISFSQTNPYPATTFEKRFEAFKQRENLRKNSLLKNVKLRSIGPTIMSGRVTDIDVDT